jgi:hypothetical protein
LKSGIAGRKQGQPFLSLLGAGLDYFWVDKPSIEKICNFLWNTAIHSGVEEQVKKINPR